MKRIVLIGAVFFIGAIAAVRLYAMMHKEPERVVVQSPAEDLDWIQKLLVEYEELQWLTRDGVHVTPENSVNNPKNSYSYKLFGTNFPEFDRTIMSLNCLNLFLDGKYEDYLEFVYLQPAEDRLEWKSFLSIQRNIQSVLDHLSDRERKEARKVLEIALILSDVVKTKVVEDLAKQKGIPLGDFDLTYRTILASAPEIFPSYQKLSSYGQEMLYKLSFQRCFGYIAHLEGGAELFSVLKKADLIFRDPDSFELSLFVYQCDVGGALGHVDVHSSIAYNERSHEIIQAVRSSCLLLKTQDENVAFESYLSKRADWLGLDITSPLNRVLARIGAMLRLTKLEEGKMLKESFLKLSPEDLSLIVDAFNIPKGDTRNKVSMYIPAVLVNLFNNESLGDRKRERLAQSIHVGLPLIAKILHGHREEVFKGTPLHPKVLNFDQVAKIAREEPKRLAQETFTIDPSGHVVVAPKL